MILDPIKTAIGDQLRMRSIDKHRSRIGWRDAPRYSRYLAQAQAARRAPLPDPGPLAGAIADFARDGIAAFRTDETARTAMAISERLRTREAAGEAVWQADEHEIGNHNYAGDLWNDFPEIETMFRGPLGVFLTHHFQAHFKIFYGVLYRSVGSEKGRSGSQRWHSDSGPGICVNVMFYLHDTARENGPLEALPWPHARDIYAEEPTAVRARARDEGVDPRGRERYRLMADYYDETVESSFRADVLQPSGSAGLVVPFLNNTLHRGGFPEPGHTRTAIVFHCYPSHKPTDFDLYRRRGIAKTAPYPKDPAEEF